jgi:tetratricopeptide (TPR) repeat protein
MISLLLAALVAGPTVALEPGARPPSGPSLLDRSGRALRRLVEKPEPNVAEGNARAAAGDIEGALKAYEKADVPEHGPRAAALAHDRASALLRAGDAQLAPQAVQEANRGLAEGDAPLKAIAAYDLGYALEQSGRPDEAIAAYARALQLDPEDRDAKVNLELLLREEERKQKQPHPGGQPEKDKKQPQAGKDTSRSSRVRRSSRRTSRSRPGRTKKTKRRDSSSRLDRSSSRVRRKCSPNRTSRARRKNCKRRETVRWIGARRSGSSTR